ncbi:MAG: fructosamine kinase family protein [Sulfuricellaceae bacterium]
MWDAIKDAIMAATGEPFSIATRRSIGGGCINAAWVVEGGGLRYFVKTNTTERLAMFEAERDGLRELANAAAVRVPQPVCLGCADGSAFLVLEHIFLKDAGQSGAELLGRQLAAQHHVTAPAFGWWRDNTLGATFQPNTPSADWIAFWRERRLGHQLNLAARAGHHGALQRRGEKLLAALPAFFRGYMPQPALLHGDLWSGNAACDPAGKPVIFDPATYYGDREADIAMTELFGGYPLAFYAAYRESFPLDPGYATRKTLYNLYHILNHLNLFGGGYLAQAEKMMGTLLAEVG